VKQRAPFPRQRSRALLPSGVPHDLSTLLTRAAPPDAASVRPRFCLRRLGLIALAACVVALAAVGLASVDLAAALGSLAGADPQMLAAAIALYALGQTMSGGMWMVCQRAGGVRGIPMGTQLGMHWVSRAACELLPASLGEAVRVAVVRRHAGGARAGICRIAGGVAGYKAIDAVVTGAVVLALALIVPMPGPAGAVRWSAVAVVVALAGAALAWRLGATRHLLRLVPRRARLGARRIGEGAGILRDPAGARSAALLGLAALVVRVLSLAALLLALGAPAEAAALAFCVITLAGAIPGAPGGAGAREVVLIPALVLAHGISAPTALAFSVAVQAVALGTSLAIAAVALAWFGPGLVRGRTAPVADEPELVGPAPEPATS
jgi:glycosyltransferase AglD